MRTGDAANRVRFLDDRPRRPAWSVDLDSWRHFRGGDGDRSPVQASGHDRASTTRNPGKIESLIKIGVDHVLIDDGSVAKQVRGILPDGVDAALELVGTPTLPDTLSATRLHGVVCFTGMLSNEWIVRDFYPIDYIPQGVRLTAYAGEASDLPPEVLQDFLNAVAAGEAVVPLHRVYFLDQIRDAHAEMEAGSATGKIVVLPNGV